MPSTPNILNTFGLIWMPAPTSPNSRACSRTTLGQPILDKANAAASPPIPPPAIRTGELESDACDIDRAFKKRGSLSLL
jgi:hypothetical protein